MENNRRPISQKERKQIEKKRKSAAKQAQKYHKEQNKKIKKSSRKPADKKTNDKVKKSSSKIEQAINSRPETHSVELTREEKYLRQSERKIRNLEPKDFSDGYYVDEYGERQKQQRRAREIHKQEAEVIHRRKKPLSPKQIKRRRALLYSFIVFVVLVIGAVLSLTVLFKTENIVVEGDEYYSDEQIVEYSGVELQENIFMAALTGNTEEIVDNLPYVESASINFTIPDTVTIKITNAVPTYTIKNGDSYLLISAEGRILDSVSKNEDNLPELKCDELKSTVIGDYVKFSDSNVPDILEEISDSLNSNNVENITGIDVTDTANIGLVYDERIDINLGLPEDIDYKIRTAITIITEKLDPNDTGTVTGTLDVSSCNTTKMSHYKPAETTATEATAESTTETTTAAADADDYTWEVSDDSYSADSYSDDSAYSSDEYSDEYYSDGYYSDYDSYSADEYTYE